MSIFDFDKNVVSKNENDNGLKITHFKSIDGRHNIVSIEHGKFFIEKRFLANYEGTLEMKSFLDEIQTKEDLLKKLGVA